MSIVYKQEAFIVTGYNYSTIEEFQSAINVSKNCTNLIKDFKRLNTTNIKIRINDVPVSNNQSPHMLVYANGEKEIQLCYNKINRQMEILTKDYDNNKDFIEKILFTFAQLRLQEAKSIVLSFMNHYNKGENKLCLFNENIHKKLSDFSNNEGFEVSLPVDLTSEFGCKGIYGVGKVNTKNNNEHIYEIVANYIFNFTSDSADTNGRIQELEQAINKSHALYKHYNEICNQIVEL